MYGVFLGVIFYCLWWYLQYSHRMTSNNYFDQLTRIEGRKSLTELSDRKQKNNMETASRKG